MKVKPKFKSDNLFFTSDTHFFHSNIIKYCNRIYNGELIKDVGTMNEILIENWNKTVGVNDTIFHLGDFSLMGKSKELLEILKRLNGKKYLVKGNHESDILSKKYLRDQFVITEDIIEITVEDEDTDQHILMCHYPMLAWNRAKKGSWQLYGHIHGALKKYRRNNTMDVGVDCNNLFPFSYEEIKTKLKLNK